MLEARWRSRLVSDGNLEQPASPVTFYDPNIEPPPSAFDVVWCNWPLGATGGFKHRPGLVRKRLRDESGKNFVIEVCYGTSKIQKHFKGSFYIENEAKLNLLSLPQATRFELGQTHRFPWGPHYFPKRAEDGAGPILGRLDTHQAERVKRIVWDMQQR